MFIATALGAHIAVNKYWDKADHAPPPTYDPNAAKLQPAANRAATQDNRAQARKGRARVQRR